MSDSRTLARERRSEREHGVGKVSFTVKEDRFQRDEREYTVQEEPPVEK